MKSLFLFACLGFLPFCLTSCDYKDVDSTFRLDKTSKVCFRSQDLLSGALRTRFVTTDNPASKISYYTDCQGNEHKIWDFLGFIPKTQVRFSPFEDVCLGCNNEKERDCSIQVSHDFDYLGLLQYVVAFLLFFYAPSLSRNDFVIYSSAFSLGATLAFVVVLFYTIRRISGGKIAFIFAATGMMAQGYFASFILEHFLTYALIFSVLFGLIGMALVYRYDIGEKDRVLLSIVLRVGSLTLAFTSFPSASTAPFPLDLQQDPSAVCATGFIVLFSLLCRCVNHFRRSSCPWENTSEAEKKTFQEVDDGDYYAPIPMGTRVRELWNSMVSKKLSPQKAKHFVVRGAEPYISADAYEQQSMEFTRKLEADLVEEYIRNSEKYSTILTPQARRAMQRLVRARQETTEIFKDHDRQN